MRSTTVLTLALPLIAAFPHSPVDGAAKRDNVKRWNPTQGELDGSKWDGAPDEMDGSKWNKIYWRPGPGEMDGSKWNGSPDEMDGSKWHKPAGNGGSKPPAPQRPAQEAPSQPQPVDDTKGPNEAGDNQGPTPPTTISQTAAELQPPPEDSQQRRPQEDNRWRFPQGPQQPQTSQESSTQQGNPRPEALLSNEGANGVQGNAAPDSGSPPTPADANEDNTIGDEPSYMSIVNKWRAKLGKPELKYDKDLETSALHTSSLQTDPANLEHHGNTAQIMAPGTKDNFEKVLVGGWICELPDQLEGLRNICNDKEKVGYWTYINKKGEVQTGHAEIFASSDFNKIGCGHDKGVWTCNLA